MIRWHDWQIIADTVTPPSVIIGGIASHPEATNDIFRSLRTFYEYVSSPNYCGHFFEFEPCTFPQKKCCVIKILVMHLLKFLQTVKLISVGSRYNRAIYSIYSQTAENNTLNYLSFLEGRASNRVCKPQSWVISSLIQ